MTFRTPVALATLMAAVGAAACDNPAGITRIPRLGYLAAFDRPVNIEVPDTVQAGQSFTVRVDTYGTGCDRRGDTRVDVTGRTVEVTPYDEALQVLVPGFDCSGTSTFVHAVNVTVDSAGAATLRVNGWRQPENEALTVELPFFVR